VRITLCGSTRFKDLYVQANLELSKQGHSVYSIAWAKEDQTQSSFKDEIIKENLDLVHLDKILNSDLIIVLGQVNDAPAEAAGTTKMIPYIGRSTRREIVWAQMHRKEVFFGLEEFYNASGFHTEYCPTVIDVDSHIQYGLGGDAE
jgi:hypothetical protein